MQLYICNYTYIPYIHKCKYIYVYIKHLLERRYKTVESAGIG